MASAEHSRYGRSILGEQGEVGGAEQHTPEQPASPAREPLAEEPAVVVGSSKKRKRQIERQLPKRARKFSGKKGQQQGSSYLLIL
jgi:hypothetical protein